MLFALAFLFNANATNLFTGDHAVTWDTPLNLEAAKFAEAKAGDKIVVTYTNRIYGIQRNCWSVNCYEGEMTVKDIQLKQY